ncbi:MAG TPA: ABC transporter permease [Gemmatimonadaceae bacterium]|nr:ABC transporter permease [Gemmatimonadaceae bacterium]
MAIMHRLGMWLAALLRRERLEYDLDREMRFHLDMEIEANVRRGMVPEEARRQALLAFGGVDRHKESARDERGTRILESVLSEFRFAVRGARLNRGFALITTLTLAVGIGATAAVYSFANWVLYRPVPGVVAPDELVLVSFEDNPGQPTGISYHVFETLRDSVPAFAGLTTFGFSSRFQVAATGDGARTVAGNVVAGDFFGVLGVTPAAGRLLAPDELTPHSGARVAVLSEALATSMFGSAQGAVGKSLRINAVPFVVAGVATGRFRGTFRVGEVDVWLPNAAYAALQHNARYDASSRASRPFFTTIGRLKPGATIAAAQSQLRRVTAALVAQYPKENEVFESHPPTVYPDIGSNVLERQMAQTSMRLMFGIAGLALLIACANVAGLLLFRGVKREPEMAVRRALGASSSRLLGQHLAEGVVLGIAGAAGGVVIATLLRKLFEGHRIVALTGLEQAGIDERVLVFVGTLAFAAGITFGLIPGIAAVSNLRPGALRDAGRRTTSAGSAVRSALTVGQIAASVSLIVGALLLARTIVGLRQVDIGFEPRNVYAFSIDPDPQGYTRERVQSMRLELPDALRRQNGIDAASTAWTVPFRGVTFVSDFRLASSPDPTWTLNDARVMWVGAEYFRTLGIPLLAGRALSDDDVRAAHRDSTVAVVLSVTAARELFGARNPLGEVIVERTGGVPKSRIVVGVVGDTRDGDLRSPVRPVIYEPVGATMNGSTTLVVRSPRPLRDLQGVVERAVAAIDPALPVPPARRLEDLVAGAMGEEVVFLRLVGLLATIAAVLAGVGLYALLAFGVAGRTREIGVRMALGARRADVVTGVARQGGRLLATGIVIGLGVALFATRLLESRLFGVSRLDPLTYVGAVAALAVTGLVACALPARQAARVDPVTALRAE